MYAFLGSGGRRRFPSLRFFSTATGNQVKLMQLRRFPLKR
jgi:hypothetical protein